jgi:hypothetical protein
MENAGIAFQAGRMKSQIINNMGEPPESLLWGFKSHAPHKAMHFIAETEEMFGQIAAILSSDTRDESFLILHHTLFPATLEFVTTESLKLVSPYEMRRFLFESVRWLLSAPAKATN